jgi:hypothetical protein
VTIQVLAPWHEGQRHSSDPLPTTLLLPAITTHLSLPHSPLAFTASPPPDRGGGVCSTLVYHQQTATLLGSSTATGVGWLATNDTTQQSRSSSNVDAEQLHTPGDAGSHALQDTATARRAGQGPYSPSAGDTQGCATHIHKHTQDLKQYDTTTTTTSSQNTKSHKMKPPPLPPANKPNHTIRHNGVPMEAPAIPPHNTKAMLGGRAAHRGLPTAQGAHTRAGGRQTCWRAVGQCGVQRVLQQPVWCAESAAAASVVCRECCSSHR